MPGAVGPGGREEGVVGGVRVVLGTAAPVSHRTAEENLGLGYLAAVLRGAGYRVDVVDGWLAGLTAVEVVDRIGEGDRPLLVGLSCYRSNIDAAIQVMHGVRERCPRVPVVVGGFGPTFHPGEFLAAGFDVAVRGEAETTILDLVSHYRTGTPGIGEIPGISYTTGTGMVHAPDRESLADLDRLPVPARDTLGLAITRRSLVHVQSARGCQAACTFCSIVAFERLGGAVTWRQRSLVGFVAELEALAGRGVRYVKVVDDSFVEPPRDEGWCAELAEAIGPLRLRLRGSVRADRVTPGVLGHLRRAGFFSFSCGIENYSPTALRRMAKHARVEDNVAALEEFDRHGLFVQAGHILFDHATTLAELRENWAGMTRFAWTISKGVFTEMYAASGTAFTRTLARRGLTAGGRETSGTAGVGNNAYPVADPAAAAVHAALKTWHRSHCRTYDMTIDPLSAPKAIPVADQVIFHRLGLALRGRDLDFFGAVLDLAESGRLADIPGFTAEQIESSATFYARIDEATAAAYRAAGLVYDAQDNPFIH